ncbi:MAG: antibiotic biosynthesis monooxygenase [Actinobacteria bacterium]|nr:antibiotic biosynthesis monooxygenase [Actinomycetota bacterium]
MSGRITLLTLVLALLGAGVMPVSGQEKEHPIEAEVKAALKDPAKPFTMLVFLKVKEGAGAKFEEAFGKAIGPTRKEKGNRAYDLNRSAMTPNEYLLYERWQNLAALRAHLRAPHITTLLGEVGDLLDGAPEVRVALPAAE